MNFIIVALPFSTSFGTFHLIKLNMANLLSFTFPSHLLPISLPLSPSPLFRLLQHSPHHDFLLHPLTSKPISTASSTSYSPSTSTHTMAPKARSRAARHNSTATGSSYKNTPDPPPPARRSGVSTRGVRVAAADDTSHSLPTPSPTSTRVAAHYTLPPTVPSPFAGTLDASLEHIFSFGTSHAPRNGGVQGVLDTLLRPVDSGTNWPVLLRDIYLGESGREVLEEILFLVTRALLPQQVAENRAAMGRMYERKKSLAIRMVLRYDMLRGWRGEGVGSVPPSLPPAAASNGAAHTNGHASGDGKTNGSGNGNGVVNGNANIDIEMSDTSTLPTPSSPWKRQHLMPNILPTLIAAPPHGYSTHGVRERMKHHPTALDTYLLLSDKTVARWSDQTLLAMASQIVLQWQWLRQNNEMFADMEVYGYEEVEGRADECEWVVDGGGKRRSVVGGEGED